MYRFPAQIQPSWYPHKRSRCWRAAQWPSGRRSRPRAGGAGPAGMELLFPIAACAAELCVCWQQRRCGQSWAPLFCSPLCPPARAGRGQGWDSWTEGTPQLPMACSETKAQWKEEEGKMCAWRLPSSRWGPAPHAAGWASAATGMPWINSLLLA